MYGCKYSACKNCIPVLAWLQAGGVVKQYMIELQLKSKYANACEAYDFHCWKVDFFFPLLLK